MKKQTILLTIIEIVLGVFFGWKIGTGQTVTNLQRDGRTVEISWQTKHSLDSVAFRVYKRDDLGVSIQESIEKSFVLPESSFRDSSVVYVTAFWKHRTDLESDPSNKVTVKFPRTLPPSPADSVIKKYTAYPEKLWTWRKIGIGMVPYLPDRIRFWNYDEGRLRETGLETEMYIGGDYVVKIMVNGGNASAKLAVSIGDKIQKFNFTEGQTLHRCQFIGIPTGKQTVRILIFGADADLLWFEMEKQGEALPPDAPYGLNVKKIDQ